jgi:hypothetical protein
MTISSTTVKNSYAGNGTLDTFNYTFKIFADADIQVIIRDATATETVKTLTTHYTVTGVGSASGGTIVFTAGNIPTATETVVIRRASPQTQAIDYIANDPFPAESHEEGLDRSMMAIQQLQEEVDRSIKLSRTNTMNNTEFTIGDTDRANKVFGFDSAGELVVTQELGTFRGDWSASTAYEVRDLVKDTSTNNIFICLTAHTSSGSEPLTTNTDSAKWSLIVDAASATSSASAAASSASLAGGAVVAAYASEVAAATSESNAATSESNAATSEANAAASYDSFDDRYLGAKASDPSVDNDGDALIDGALYFDTTNNVMKVYDLGGTVWKRTTPTTAEQTNIDSVTANETNINTVSTNIASVNTVATNITDVIAVANDLTEAVSEVETVANDLNEAVSEIDTVATSITNVDIVGNNISNVNTVASISSNVTSVAGISGNVSAVAGISSDVTSVAGDATDIGTVATDLTGSDTIGTVAGSISNVNTVSSSIANVNTVANDLNEATSEIDTVATNITNVNTVGGISADVTTVAGINTEVVAVAGDASDIGTVASNIGSVSAVGSDLANNFSYIEDNGAITDAVTSTAGTSLVETVADDIANVNLVGGSIANVNLVGGSIANVNTVAADGADIGTVAGISSNVTTVAGIASDVTTVATNNTNVTTVATNISGVNSFADRYRVASADPTTSLDEGDLAYNTTANVLKYYDGSTWNPVVAGALTDVVQDGTPQLGGDLDGQNNNLNNIGTIDGTNLQIDFGGL